jgi:hypothetical protein
LDYLLFEDIAVPSQLNVDLFDNARGFSNFAAPGQIDLE